MIVDNGIVRAMLRCLNKKSFVFFASKAGPYILGLPLDVALPHTPIIAAYRVVAVEALTATEK